VHYVDQLGDSVWKKNRIILRITSITEKIAKVLDVKERGKNT